jgi:hypothetical protein
LQQLRPKWAFCVPEVTQIVDLYHVRQHRHDLVGILEFMLGGQRDDWLAAHRSGPSAGIGR